MTENRTLLIVLDDSESALDAVRELENDQMEVMPIEPNASQDETVAAILSMADVDRPVVVVVDYRLDEPGAITYRGGSVAAGIKDSRPDLPVAMITSDSVMRDLLESRPVARHSFDSIVLKGRLLSEESSETVAGEFRSLAEGFLTLREMIAASDPAVLSTDLIRMALASDARDLDGAELWVSSEIEDVSVQGLANWLLGSFLKTVGPLCAGPEAAASLGLTLDGFRAVVEANLISASRYAGVFAEIMPRWWRADLLALRASFTSQGGDLDFGKLGLSRNSGAIAECTWCKDDVSRACSQCGMGCDESHSLPLAKQHGRWGLPLVACFLCVAEGKVPPTDIDPYSSELVDLLIRGTIERPEHGAK